VVVSNCEEKSGSGTRALIEIHNPKKTVVYSVDYSLLRLANLYSCPDRTPHLPFQLVVREVCGEYTIDPFRFTAEALLALQEQSEGMRVRTTLFLLHPIV
jgi:hypothetical protein